MDKRLLSSATLYIEKVDALQGIDIFAFIEKRESAMYRIAGYIVESTKFDPSSQEYKEKLERVKFEWFIYRKLGF